MARKSTKRATSPDVAKPALDRPFDPSILARARGISRKYRIVLEPCDDAGYIGSSLEMPGVFADGKAPDGCGTEVREELAAAVAYVMAPGETPPVPASEQVRDRQVNIRVTEAEQLRLREAAKAQGFNDISDYVRTTSLSGK